MDTLLLNIFPAEATTPAGTFSGARVFATASRAWVFANSGAGPVLVDEVEVTLTKEDVRGYGPWEFEGWRVAMQGGCGCGNTLKRYSPDELLAMSAGSA